MPLMSAAVAAMPDDLLRAVRFVMKDGTKPVVVLVSHAALEDAESALLDESGYFHRFSKLRCNSSGDSLEARTSSTSRRWRR